MKKHIITNKNHFPKCIQKFDCVEGICIGGCVAGGMIENKADAHAHATKGYKYTGWICLKYASELKDKHTLLHEVAHLLVNRSSYTSSHGKKWKAKVVEIGSTYRPYEYKIGKHTYCSPGYDEYGRRYYLKGYN